MNVMQWLVVFGLDEQRFALYLSAVDRVVPAVEVNPLPKAPGIVVGVINVQGCIVPVVDVRERFGLAACELLHTHQFILARASGRRVALIVDQVHGVAEYAPDTLAPAAEILSGLEYVEGVVKLKDGMALIHDLDRFLSLEEQNTLEQSLLQTRSVNAATTE
jgi:purine-binding chemotaxis protein CheW